MLAERLSQGLELPDRTGRVVRYRFLAPTDDFDALTDLLHAAYAPLAAAGMRFFASHQSVDVTRERAAKGDTIVAEVDGRVIGTATLATIANTSGSPFCDRPDVASLGQFAVAPALQGCGIGSTLMRLVEQRALELGAAHITLNTSEQAVALIRYYEARGYRFVEHVQWADVNYRSVVLAKVL